MKLLLIILTILSSGCMQNNFSATSNDSHLKRALTNEIRYKVAMQLKREKNLIPFGSGGGTMNGVRMLALSFLYSKEVSIDEARELLMTAGNLFLKTVNDEEKIRPYLVNYPFQPKNIEIQIVIQNSNGSTFGNDKLCIITMRGGILKYNTQNVETRQLITVYKETYEEAAAKLDAKETVALRATTTADSCVQTSGL